MISDEGDSGYKIEYCVALALPEAIKPGKIIFEVKGLDLKLLEYEAKEVFRSYGIPTPEGGMATNPEEAISIANELGGPIVVKAQLPVGGRGKSGGIRFLDTASQVFDEAKSLLGIKIKDVEIKKLLIEEKVDVFEELYLGVTVDRVHKCYVILASKEGGVDIEEVASKTPDKIIRVLVDPIIGVRGYHTVFVAKKLGYTGERMQQLGGLLLKLYNLAVEMDAELTEINPLVEVEDGFVAVDARLNVDNNALFRHNVLRERLIESFEGELSDREIEARKRGLIYVELDGNIGIIGNGAGLTMATLDTIMLNGGRAANFLDLGGGATADRIREAVEFVLSDARTKALFVNVLGGITRGNETAKGIVEARKVHEGKPIVVRLMGTKQEEGQRILRESGVETYETMEKAAEMVVGLMKGD
jgi:succinyl-CoA synthetase beta subunit